MKNTDLCRKTILDLIPYVPGKPIEEVKRELGIDDIIKLASNENPLGPSPKALAAMKDALDNIALYPEGSCHDLRNELAKFLGVGTDNLIFGCGADEIIHFLGIAFLEDGDEIIQGYPSFMQYKAASTLMGCKTHLVPLNDKWEHDIDAMLAKVNDKTKLFFITNPNNPTGTLLDSSVIEKVLKALPERCILVLDEAYYEFADDPSYTKSIEWVKEDKNVFVMRTFSKVYALAGIRVGYGVAAKRIIDLIERVRGPFNVNSVAQVGAVASLRDPEQLRRSREQIARSKAYIYKALEEMGIEYTPTQANFIWINVKKNCREVFQDLMKLGVIVRTGDIFGHPTYLRVTFGTDEQNERFIKSLKEVLK